MTDTGTVLAQVARGIELRRQSCASEARALFEQLWAEIGGEAGDPLARCAIAHSAADVQDDVPEELRWDLRALEAARAVTEEQVVAAGMGASAAGMFPSLHLNLAECYRKLGDTAQACAHLREARATENALPADGYGDMIRDGVTELARRLGA